MALAPAAKRVLDTIKANPDEKPKEIAGRLGISESAVRTQMTRLRKSGHLPKSRRGRPPAAKRPRRPLQIVAQRDEAGVAEGFTAVPEQTATAVVADVVSDQLAHVEAELAQIEVSIASDTERRTQLELDRDKLQQAQAALGSGPQAAVLAHLPKRRTSARKK